MRHRGNGLRFALKASVRFGVVARLHEHLHGDESLELRIAAEVHASHSAFTDDADEQHTRAKRSLKRNSYRVMLEGRNRYGLTRDQLPRDPGNAGRARHWRYDMGRPT